MGYYRPYPFRRGQVETFCGDDEERTKYQRQRTEVEGTVEPFVLRMQPSSFSATRQV